MIELKLTKKFYLKWNVTVLAIFGSENLCFQKYVSEKKFWVKENFGSKKVLDDLS